MRILKFFHYILLYPIPKLAQKKDQIPIHYIQREEEEQKSDT